MPRFSFHLWRWGSISLSRPLIPPDVHDQISDRTPLPPVFTGLIGHVLRSRELFLTRMCGASIGPDRASIHTVIRISQPPKNWSLVWTPSDWPLLGPGELPSTDTVGTHVPTHLQEELASVRKEAFLPMAPAPWTLAVYMYWAVAC